MDRKSQLTTMEMSIPAFIEVQTNDYVPVEEVLAEPSLIRRAVFVAERSLKACAGCASYKEVLTLLTRTDLPEVLELLTRDPKLSETT